MIIPKNAHLWLPGYIRSAVRRRHDGLIDILFCIADHFEPDYGGVSDPIRRTSRVDRWCHEYPRLAQQFQDADGVHPRHTFFFPAERYEPDLIERLAALCRSRLAECEVHLHHEHDTDENLLRTLRTFTSTLAQRHGLLSADEDGRVRFGFIHGNWALANSLPNGRFCGVDNELNVLIDAGCYADFTMPSMPAESQSAIVNAIYLTSDNARRPGSHRHGTAARVGMRVRPAQLLMISGPLHLSWRGARWGVLPRIDIGTIDFRNAPTRERFERWLRAAAGVADRPEWAFVKVHTHGAPEANADILLGPAMRCFHEELALHFNDGVRYRLHYVSAREMANIAHAAMAGAAGNPHVYRDYRYRLVAKA